MPDPGRILREMNHAHYIWGSRLGWGTGCILAVTALTACGDSDESDSVEQAAVSVADAVASGDFSTIELAEGDPQTLISAAENLHAPFEGLTPEVTVEEISLDEPADDSPQAATAEVTFDHHWDLEQLGIDGEAFSYSTSAELSYAGDEDEHDEGTWLLHADPEILLPDYQGHEEVGMATTEADRGRMMDGEGRAMVYNRDVVRIGIDKTQLPDLDDQTQEEAAEELAEAVEIDADDYVESVLGHGDESFVEAITVREEGGDVTVEDIENLTAVATVEDTMSLADSADFAPLLIGSVGPVTAEHLDEDPSLEPHEQVGISGLQAAYEEQLRGTPGMRIYQAGETLYSIDPEPGEDIQTTLNPQLQNIAEDIVQEEDTTAGVVAMRPSDGGILAAASHSPEDSWVSTVTQSTYAPGSTFKVVSALAMLRNGLSPDSTVTCPDETTVHGQVFGNVPGYPEEYLGEVDFEEAVAASCNTVFADAYDDVTSDELHQAAVDLGLVADPEIGLEAQLGSVPQESDMNLHAADLFGQGEVEASTLGMATVAASIGAGETVQPYLVEEAPDGEEAAEEDSAEEVPEEQASGVTSEEAEELRELMYGTVEYGTLESMDSIPGEHVYAKTGTAEVGEGDDAYAHTWVIGLQDDLAVAIFLEDGEFGSSTNGPLLHEFLTEADNVLG